MKLHACDIPQAPRLSRIRGVVDAVSTGRRSKETIAAHAKMKARDADYHLKAATRVLSLLVEENGTFRLSDRGRAMSSTEPGSEEEREIFVAAVRDSPVLKAWAGDLLGRVAPMATMIRRAQSAGLSEATATQRAHGVLRWREQLQGGPRLRYGTRTPGVLETRDSLLPSAFARRSMLRSLRLTNFKSFTDETIELAPLTVFVGANASGKSNALDAIRFLQGLALDFSVSDVLRGRHEGGRIVWPAIRGGIAEVCRSGAEDFSLETEWTLDGTRIAHRIECTVSPAALVTAERLVGEGLGEYLFDTHAKTLGQSVGLQEGRAINVALKGLGGGRNPTQQCSGAFSLLGQVQGQPRVSPVVLEWAQRVQQSMRQATFLSISPAAMREWAPLQALTMGADGANISAVVHRLCEMPGGARKLVDWISELCAPKVVGIKFANSDLGEVILQLEEEGGARVSARSLSDGTLRFLGELVAVLTAEPGSLLLVEEIENGLHPQRLQLLVHLLETVTAERNIQVIASTHSPLVLLALSKEARDNAVVFARVEGQPGTMARRLKDIENFEEVSARRDVDRLFASGWLERAL
jgi:predicted ATPase